MLKIAFLCSGNGGNLRFINEAIRLGWLKNATLCGVITDRECLANQFAKEHNIWTDKIDFLDKEQLSLIAILNHLCADIIITNVHKILAPTVIEAFKNNLLNLHYSLLPAFAGTIGTKPIKMSLDYGAKFVGTTVHQLTTQVDLGLPIVQTVIPVKNGDTIDNLMDIVFRSGCIALLNGIQLLYYNQHEPTDTASHLIIGDRAVLINPMVTPHIDYQSENIWQTIKLYPHTKPKQ